MVESAGSTLKKDWARAVTLALSLKIIALILMYYGWMFLPRAEYKADLWMTRPDTSFMDNLANFDGAWFVRVAAIGHAKLASGDYDLARETARLRVMDELGREQGLWKGKPEPIGSGYGYRHWLGFVWLVRAAGAAGLDYVASAVFLSNLFTVIYCVLLYMLAREDLKAAGAALAVSLAAFHPGGYSLTGAYNESMFLALAAGAMLSARKKKFLLCGALGAAAAATRIFGAFLAVPLFYEWMAARTEGEGDGFARVLSPSGIKGALAGIREWPGVWWALLIPMGTMAVLLGFYLAAGDALIWTRVHEVNEYGTLNWPWLMMKETYNKGWHVWMKELPLHGLLLAVLFLGFKGARKSYWIWMALFFAFHATNSNHSYLRYQVQCLPLFIELARLLEGRPAARMAAICLFAGAFGLFAALYVNGYWVA